MNIDDYINVRRLEIFAGKIADQGCIIIENFINEETNDKYISYCIFNNTCITQIYKYPYVNPILYSIIQYINHIGPSYTIGRNVYGPNLIDLEDSLDYYLFEILDNDNLIIEQNDIISKETPIELQELFEDLTRYQRYKN